MKQKLIGLFVSLGLVFSPSALAATDMEIETAIADGITWLAAQQSLDGSWGSYYQVAHTCFALTKLQERAWELGYAGPFDPSYPYRTNVIDGWQYVLQVSYTKVQNPLNVQDHTSGATGTLDNPDVNGNGYGIYFADPGDTRHNNYTTGVCLMALYAGRMPNRPNDGGLDFNADSSPDTYLELAQEAVEWLAWSQIDGGPGEGSWDYSPADNNLTAPYDGSIGGYAALGLAVGQAFGATVPTWVKTEMIEAFDNMQCLTAGPNYGGQSYRSYCSWVNLYKTGHLLWGLAVAGVPQSDQRFQDALAYIENHWRDVNTDPGWGYNTAVADYQGMFVLMKGLAALGIDLIDTDLDTVRDDDWFQQDPPLTPADDFASVLVAQQNGDGSWPSNCRWGSAVLCTSWALITLEKDLAADIDIQNMDVEQVPIPTLSLWAYTTLAGLLILLGYVRLRRQHN